MHVKLLSAVVPSHQPVGFGNDVAASFRIVVEQSDRYPVFISAENFTEKFVALRLGNWTTIVSKELTKVDHSYSTLSVVDRQAKVELSNGHATYKPDAPAPSPPASKQQSDAANVVSLSIPIAFTCLLLRS